MPIYTRKGDKGSTSTISEKALKKNSRRIEAIGTVDELNSFFGVIKTSANTRGVAKGMRNIQSELFAINATLAGKDTPLGKNVIKEMETSIDRWEATMPELKNFIYPGPSYLSALLHMARSITRRAERRIVALNEVEEVRPDILIFMNRLSDFLFTLARYVSWKVGFEDNPWRAGELRTKNESKNTTTGEGGV